MNQHPTATVRNVEGLLALPGVKAPKALTDALDAFHAIKEPVAADLTADYLAITAAEVPARLERMALVGAMKDAHGVARGELQELLGRRVLAHAGTIVDTAADILQAEFDARATEFVALLAKLPDTYLLADTDHIAQRGTKTLTVWGQARDLTQTLDGLAQQRAALVELGYLALLPAVIEARTRYAHCADVNAFDALGNLPTVIGFSRWPSIARTPGVRLRWMAPREQIDQARTLEATRPARAQARQPQRRTVVA